MAREEGVEFEEAVYHVLDCGDRCKAIFGNEAEPEAVPKRSKRAAIVS